MTPGNPLSISVAPASSVVGGRYFDLEQSLAIMARLHDAGVVDGFEFQNLAEWDASGPPRDEAARRRAAWEASSRYTVAELAERLLAEGRPVFSVHANRDVGVCLCSEELAELAAGERLLRESLWLAERVGAPVVVLHLWDTWKQAFDPGFLEARLRAASAAFPGVRVSVENVPTQRPGCSPFELVQCYDWITLDLQWAALYDELDRFEAVGERLANVHLRGRLKGGRWELPGAPWDFYSALERVLSWGYEGPLTMEPSDLQAGDWEALCAAMRSCREAAGC